MKRNEKSSTISETFSRNSASKKFFEKFQVVRTLRKKTNKSKAQLVRKKNPMRKHIPDKISITAEKTPHILGQNVMPMTLKMAPSVCNDDMPSEKYRIPNAMKSNPRTSRINSFPKFSLSQKLTAPFMSNVFTAKKKFSAI
jgi:hypothetical protein